MTSNVKRLAWVYLALILPCLFFSQRATSVYLSAEDFLNNKSAFTNNSASNYKIKLHAFPFKNFIRLKYKHKFYLFRKDSIFGYKDNNGTCYRFSGKEIYTILNPQEQIVIYSLQAYNTDARNFNTYTSYFFSENLSSPIIPLNKKQLETSFSYNSAFLKLIELYFKTDASLSEYDVDHHQYKLNRLLQLSKIQ